MNRSPEKDRDNGPEEDHPANGTAIPPLTEDSLAGAVVSFGRLLKEHSLSISLPSVMDALKGISSIGVENPGDFRTTLKTNFIRRVEEGPLFERLFVEFDFVFWGFDCIG